MLDPSLGCRILYVTHYMDCVTQVSWYSFDSNLPQTAVVSSRKQQQTIVGGDRFEATLNQNRQQFSEGLAVAMCNMKNRMKYSTECTQELAFS